MTLADDQAHERVIETAHLAYMSAIQRGDPDEILESFDILAELVGNRSVEQIARMELERGLRA